MRQGERYVQQNSVIVEHFQGRQVPVASVHGLSLVYRI